MYVSGISSHELTHKNVLIISARKARMQVPIDVLLGLKHSRFCNRDVICSLNKRTNDKAKENHRDALTHIHRVRDCRIDMYFSFVFFCFFFFC